MAEFKYTALMNSLSKELGEKYTLFLDYGTVDDTYHPYRVINEIITPIVGVFRLNPVQLTALKTPYIGVVSAIIDIPAPTEYAEEVRDTLNDLAARKNATTEKVVQGETKFTIAYSFETAVVGDKRRDVSLYNGEVIPITQVINYTIIEAGVTALDVIMRIDGHTVPILNLEETRSSVSETVPDENAHGKSTVNQDMYGVSFTTPYVDNPLGELLSGIVGDGGGNVAHAVEIEKNGLSRAYIMCFGTAANSIQPPLNIGFTMSMTEIEEKAARFSDLWSQQVLSGTVVTYNALNAVVFWGDGTSSRVNGPTYHVYTDGKSSHIVRTVSYQSTERYRGITIGRSLYKKKIKPNSGNRLYVSSLPENVITMTSGDGLRMVNGRLCMAIGADVNPIDRLDTTLNQYYFEGSIVTMLRGTVSSVGADVFAYDRWAVTEES